MTPGSQRAPAGCTAARERILCAAARLVALQGYEGTSMREVAAQAGVTKPLIHYYFGSKEELFATLLRESLTACRGAATEVCAQHTSPREQLRALLRWQFERARRTPEVVAFAHEVMNAPAPLPVGFDYRAEGRALCATYVQLVEAGQQQGEFRAVDPQAVVVMMAATVRAYVTAVLSGDIDAIPDGVEDTVFDLVVHGVGAPAPATLAPVPGPARNPKIVREGAS